MRTVRIVRYCSMAGNLILGSIEGRLCLCDWADNRRREVIDRRICRNLGAKFEEGMSGVCRDAITQLDEYFAGVRKVLTIPLEFSGTEFQNLAWEELLRIPYGETCSYGEIARRLGNPNNARAVAAAIAANPISIFVPCHRVIGSDGNLTGYAGGLRAKELLLNLEIK